MKVNKIETMENFIKKNSPQWINEKKALLMFETTLAEFRDKPGGQEKFDIER